jgi:hypothetical protein
VISGKLITYKTKARKSGADKWSSNELLFVHDSVEHCHCYINGIVKSLKIIGKNGFMLLLG